MSEERPPVKKVLICVVVVLANLCSLAADTVHLTNGDHLTGQIESLTSAKLTFQTTYAGTLTIEWNHIATLSTSEPFVVEFISGVTATGTISSPEPGTLQIGANLPTPVTQVVAIRKEAASAKRGGFLASWNGRTDVGYTFVRGNTRIDNLTINFEPEWKTSINRIRTQVQSLYSVQDDAASSNMHRVQTRYDRFLSPRTFIFAQGRVETDQREKLDLRTSQGVGLGMEFLLDPLTQLSILGGMTFLQEDFQHLDTQLNAQAVAGVEFETARLVPFVIGSKSQFLPILTDGRYRLEWSANIRIPLLGGFNLGLQMFDNFDSDPPQTNVKKNDFGVISTFGFAFLTEDRR